MKITPPKQITFFISVLIFVVGMLAILMPGLGFARYGTWIIAIAFLLLAIANVTKGL